MGLLHNFEFDYLKYGHPKTCASLLFVLLLAFEACSGGEQELQRPEEHLYPFNPQQNSSAEGPGTTKGEAGD